MPRKGDQPQSDEENNEPLEVKGSKIKRCLPSLGDQSYSLKLSSSGQNEKATDSKSGSQKKEKDTKEKAKEDANISKLQLSSAVPYHDAPRFEFQQHQSKEEAKIDMEYKGTKILIPSKVQNNKYETDKFENSYKNEKQHQKIQSEENKNKAEAEDISSMETSSHKNRPQEIEGLHTNSHEFVEMQEICQ